MKILLFEPNEPPVVREIKNSLKPMQKIVGGYIETVYIGDDVVLVCNEEGKLRNLPPNRIIQNDWICGTFFMASVKGAKFKSLDDRQLASLLKVYGR